VSLKQFRRKEERGEMGESQRRWAEKQREERRILKEFKEQHPDRFAAMMQEAQRKEVERLAAEEAERVAREAYIKAEQVHQEAARRQRGELEARLRDARLKLRTALVSRALPEVEGLENVSGLVALRQWDINESGQLTSNGYNSNPWTSQMIANAVPTKENSNGLYCIQLTATGLMNQARERVTDFCGLIELRGHLEFHEQENGIRAEWAKILAIFVLEDDEDVYLHVFQLQQNYPGVPLFVTTRELVAKYLLRLALWQETGDKSYLHTVEKKLQPQIMWPDREN
jgi:hypothetical protein